jgi:hypothetical protein
MEVPFHIIKVAEFCRIAKDREARDEVQRKPKLIEIIRKWVATLDGENKHGCMRSPGLEKRLRYIRSISLIMLSFGGLLNQWKILASVKSSKSKGAHALRNINRAT